jgi:hypothetical protein
MVQLLHSWQMKWQSKVGQNTINTAGIPLYKDCLYRMLYVMLILNGNGIAASPAYEFGVQLLSD